jgi:O-antigen/teichoic acid export membrane protein
VGVLSITVIRGFTMSVACVCGLLTTHIVLASEGMQGYAFLALLSSLMLLVPLPDLGASAAVVNAIAECGPAAPLVSAGMRAVAKVLRRTALVLSGLSIGLLVTGCWGRVLGTLPTHGAVIATIGGVAFALGVPAQVGSSVLLGSGRQAVLIFVQGLQAPLTLLLVALVAFSGLGSWSGLTASAPLAATALVAGGALFAARRLVPQAWHTPPDPLPSVELRRYVVPMLVTAFGVPAAVHGGRAILAHLSTVEELAQYGLAAQFFLAAQALFSAAGMSLWPRFMAARRDGRHVNVAAHSCGFAIGATLISIAIALVAPSVAGFVSDGAIALKGDVLVAFASWLVCQSTLYPMGMYLMDERDLQFQILPTAGMVIATLAITVLLVPEAGAAAPPFAAALSIAVFQLVPYAFRCRTIQRATVAAPLALTGGPN